MKTLFLIDGHSLAYRAFFSLPPTMKTQEGQPTNAIYGFFAMLFKLIDEYKPFAMAVAFDLKEPTFRHIEYPDYKAHRAKTPDDFISQIPIIQTCLDALNIKQITCEGFEADDIIGTLAISGEQQGFHVYIVTGDLDELQLVNSHITVIANKKGISDIMMYEAADVVAKYGVTPEQIVDYKALRGDTSDNIPGVPGIGEKGAAKLLQQFYSLEGIYANLDLVVPASLQQKLRTHQQLARISQRLARIITHVPLNVNWDDLTVAPLWEKALPVFVHYEFHQLIKRYFPEVLVQTLTTIIQKPLKNYILVNTQESWEAFLKRLNAATEVAIDTETDSQNDLIAHLIGMSFAFEPNQAYYIPLAHQEGNLVLGQALPTPAKVIDWGPLFASAETVEVPVLSIEPLLALVKAALENPELTKIAHHAKFDMTVFANYGIHIRGLRYDTFLMDYLLDPSKTSHGLKNLCSEYFGYPMTSFKEITKEKGYALFSDVPVIDALDYAAADADITLQLCRVLQPKMETEQLNKIYEELELPLVKVLMDMERTGILLDTDYLEKLSYEFRGRQKKLESEIFTVVGEPFNINSPKQLGVILFEKLHLPIQKKTATGPSTDHSVLEKLALDFEIARLIIDYREMTKLLNTYIDTLPTLINSQTGRIHTSFNQAVAATGRLSSSNPNLQNIPIRTVDGELIRKAFIPKPGCVLLSVDYSQIELRLLAIITQEPNLIRAFQAGEDIHAHTAAELFGIQQDQVTKAQRSKAKEINFGIAYGMGVFGLSERLHISRTEAKEYWDIYFQRYPKVKEYMDYIVAFAQEKGYVETLWGRRRYFRDLARLGPQDKKSAERTIINTPVQGSAADIIKKAMITVWHHLNAQFTAKLLLQVHDELVLEVPLEELEAVQKMVIHDMESVLDSIVPLTVNCAIGKNWQEAK